MHLLLQPPVGHSSVCICALAAWHILSTRDVWLESVTYFLQCACSPPYCCNRIWAAIAVGILHTQWFQAAGLVGEQR
jgi:hypothetical protein